MEKKTICELVREAENNDQFGLTTLSKYVQISMREGIETTEAYIHSKHISGPTDYMGREKPFFDIVTAAVNIWFRATDIDRKNIVIRPTKEADVVNAYLATILLQQWMKKAEFGRFLNDWGLCLARHGSAVVEFIEKDGELHCSVLDWNNIIIDAVDFDANLKIKKLWLTPAQLKKNKNYDQEMVDELLDNLQPRENANKQTKDQKADYIQIYEVYGELPESYLTGKESDEDNYVEQMHVLTFQAKKDSKDEYDEYSLYSGKVAKCPLMITHLLKKDGQSYSGGAVKNSEQSQWMVNHNAKLIKDQLELASKIIFQTNDGNYVGKNALTSIENGDILMYAEGKNPITQLNNQPNIAAMQSFMASWQSNAAQINGISEAMLGENPPSGSAWRQTQALLQESHSLFELMTENKGLFIIKMMTDYVIPFFKKQLNNSDEISAILESYQIKEIDSRYVPNEAMRRLNRIKKETILSGKLYDPTNESADLQTAVSEIQSTLKGNQRFIKPSDIDDSTWKEILKDLEWELDIDVTGEAKDTQGAMATLNTVLTTLASNPGILNDPNIKMVFNKILMLAGGISPLEIQSNQPQPTPQPTAVPMGAPVPAMATATQPQPA